MFSHTSPFSVRVIGRATSLALLLLAVVLPASASAVDPEQVIGGQWTSGDLLTQIGENCSVLGNPYTEPMVSGIASYGGVNGVPVVGQRYYTAFLVSVPGDPCGPGSSAIETDLVLPPHTTIDTSAPIRCFGKPSGASSFGEITGQTWSFLGSSGPYCPTQATPSSLHSGGWSFGFRPLATGQLFQIFVPVISSAPLIGAQTSPADGFRWLTDSTGVYANPGLSTVWANVVSSSTGGSTPSIYFARPAATPYWKADAPVGPPSQQDRVELFANLYTAGLAGNLCFEVFRLADNSSVATCKDVNFNTSVPGGQPDLFQVVPTDPSSTGPNGGYVPFAFQSTDWGQDMKIVWTFTYNNGNQSVSAEAPFHTLPGPDADGDGVPDASDACPMVKGTLANGCMPSPQTDPDGDGVFGAADLCPTVNGQGALNGCPGGIVPKTPVTPPVIPPVIPPIIPPSVVLAPSVAHHAASAASVGGQIVVNTGLGLTCPGGGPTCVVSLIGAVSGAQASRTVVGDLSKTKSKVVGTLRTSIAAGKTLVLVLRLNHQGAALLRKHHHLKITLAGTASRANGPTTRLSGTITIKAPAKKRKHH